MRARMMTKGSVNSAPSHDTPVPEFDGELGEVVTPLDPLGVAVALELLLLLLVPLPEVVVVELPEVLEDVVDELAEATPGL